MAESIRKRVRDDLVQTLVNLTGAEHVSLMSDEPLEVRHKFPSLVLHLVDDVPVPNGAVGWQHRRAQFALEAWTREQVLGTIADDVEALLAEVTAALLADTGRSGLALETSVDEVVFLLLVRDQKLAGFEARVNVAYRHKFGVPDSLM